MFLFGFELLLAPRGIYLCSDWLSSFLCFFFFLFSRRSIKIHSGTKTLQKSFVSFEKHYEGKIKPKGKNLSRVGED